METRIPKIPTRLPTKRVLSDVDINAGFSEEPPRKQLPVRKLLSRRSKSCADLAIRQGSGMKRIGAAIAAKTAAIPKKPNAGISKSKSTDNIRPQVAKKVDTGKPKAAVGRPPVAAPKKPEKVEGPKAKVVKVTKPAPYDYKTRYNLLLEKYNKTVEAHNDLKKQATQLQDELAQLIEFKKKHTECETIREQLQACETQIPLLQNELKTVKRQLNTLSVDHEVLTQTKDTLEKNFSQEKERVENLTEENRSLREELMEHRDLRRKLHNSLQDLKGTIRVYCRIRPVSQKEAERVICSFNFLDETSFEIKKVHDNGNTKCEFSFDKVFTPCATQMEVFEDLAELIQSALDGYNICVFAYGQTGAGKTYTMQGDSTPSGMGMIPRSIELIFSRIARMKLTGWEYEVSVSFLEIYNENINDLLNPGSRERYEIYYNEGKGTTVSNLKIQHISSAKQLLETMQIAHRNRAVACTNFNEHSSRSHAVTKIMLRGKYKESDVEYVGSVSLVDLAGSESAKTSDRITETKNINKSLSALGSVMLALYNNDPHIPYRNSKLTYLLQSSLTGNSKTLMFVNISPFDDCYMESISSLRFASKVKEVKVSSKRNKIFKMDKESFRIVD